MIGGLGAALSGCKEAAAACPVLGCCKNVLWLLRFLQLPNSARRVAMALLPVGQERQAPRGMSEPLGLIELTA